MLTRTVIVRLGVIVLNIIVPVDFVFFAAILEEGEYCDLFMYD